jgi:CRISPR/Cas system-associated endonuclease Cas1
MVMVKRSLAAANAIVAGKSVNPIASLNTARHRRKYEKAAQRNRSSLQTVRKDPALLERAGKAAERGFEIVAEALDHGNDRNRYPGGDETVLDGGRA